MSNSRHAMKKQKIRKRRRRVTVFILLPLFLLLISAVTYGVFLYNKAQSAVEDSYKPVDRQSPKRVSAAENDLENTSILIIGVDDSESRGFESSSRSDALMVATFNKKAKSVKLLSIPRDSYVYIPKLERKDKITHAHANGGAATTIATVEELLEIPIDFYVKVNFNAFIDVVDALGGIDVEVPYTFSEQNSEDEAGAITLKKGLQKLDGEEALALARTRKKDNDIERGKRQQEILQAMIKKAISVGSISKYGDVIEAIGDNMQTDLSFNQMKSFFNYASKGTSLDIESLTLAGQDLWLENKKGQNVYYYDLDDEQLSNVQTTLKTHLQLNNDLDTEDDEYQSKSEED